MPRKLSKKVLVPDGKPRNIFVIFDTHTPYLSFRVNALQKDLVERGLDGHLKLRVVLIAEEEKTYNWNDGGSVKDFYDVPVHVLADRFHGLGPKALFHPTVPPNCLKLARLFLKYRPKITLIGGYDRAESLFTGIASKFFGGKVGILHDSKFTDAEVYGKSMKLEVVKSLFMKLYDFYFCSGKECIEYSQFLAGTKKPAYWGAWDVVDNEKIEAASRDASRDEELFQALDLKPGAEGKPPNYFLMAVRFLPKKNPKMVVDAYLRYAEKVTNPIPLIICGQGPLEEDMRGMIVEAGLEKHLKIRPWLPYDLVPRAFNLSSSVILASTHDQWGMVVNEALAAGAPVLVSHRSGAVELVKNHVNGYSFAADDPEHLAQIFTFITEDESIIPRLRKNARSSVKGFSINEYLKAHYEVFEHFGIMRREDQALEICNPL